MSPTFGVQVSSELHMVQDLRSDLSGSASYTGSGRETTGLGFGFHPKAPTAKSPIENLAWQ